ncbi:MAG TPA: multicopper oxidase domain-containing protein [Microthrixaceae bacterium]|jgi:nitrite reductase (NO-forming)|nr:multicopper oxidase domain-containing protein [Microthrixaceae bacterium]HMT25566.1 multicopper oxidase domain-containing protein [Microthrixaceae bacterium]HMT61273.1 multicopper oxidase domain-containing protein [Microthrixaceae bacterium]
MNDTQRRQADISAGGWVLSVGLAGVAIMLAFAGLWLPNGRAGSSTSSVESKKVAVSLTEFKVTPASIDAEVGQKLVLTVTNDGMMAHDLKVEGTEGTRMLEPGTSETITIGPFDSATEAWCTVAGHKESGMVMAIQITGSAPAAAGTPATATSGGAEIDATAEPEANWKPYDPTLAPAPGGTVHDVEMHATEEEIEVAPGVTQMMWTFDGKVPGTILRGKVGDLFNVTLVNDGKVGHSIDFHASRVAWNDEMRTIESGERLVYQFKADYAGAFMYHCGTAPALHHIGNGMYGAIIIDPPELAPVDHEYVLVQSELYLGANGKEGDLTKMLAEDFDAVVFNGYYNQYKFAPIRVEPNQRVRVWVIDDGPSENSAFHIVGTIFDTVWKEGTYLLRPDSRRGGSQVLDLQPAQGGFVEFSFAEPGFYPIVTHKFANASKGALGLFQAGDVTMPAAAGH